MKSRTRWIMLVGALLFVGYVVYGTVFQTRVSCEVCLQFGDEMVCRRGGGATEAEALRAAQESSCGGNASGMSENIACRSRTPERAHCTTT